MLSLKIRHTKENAQGVVEMCQDFSVDVWLEVHVQDC